MSEKSDRREAVRRLVRIETRLTIIADALGVTTPVPTSRIPAEIFEPSHATRITHVETLLYRIGEHLGVDFKKGDNNV